MTQSPVTHAFAAVGDIMLGDSSVSVGFGFHSSYPRDAGPALARVRDTLRRHEIVFGNLECLLTPTGIGATRFRSDQMRGDAEYARDLRNAGFTALSVANNHAMQHGRSAFDATVSSLAAAGISSVGLAGDDGWCARPVITAMSTNRRVGLLGYSWRPPQYGTEAAPYAAGGIVEVERDVKRLAALTDDVIVSLHWGEEFVDHPSVKEVAHARRIIDAGARVIVGHHPHVRRVVERYNDGIICYSLGNFVSDMTWRPQLREGLLLSCELSGGAPRSVAVYGTRIDRYYAPAITGQIAAWPTASPAALAAPEYDAAVRRTVRRQQVASYLHAARNVLRFPFPVLAALVASTLRNKVSALAARVAPSSASRRG